MVVKIKVAWCHQGRDHKVGFGKARPQTWWWQGGKAIFSCEVSFRIKVARWPRCLVAIKIKASRYL